jgi:fluoride exporter
VIGRRSSSAPRPMWQQPGMLLAVAAGGLLGAPARYGLGALLPTRDDGFPWATLLINVSGALLLGILVVVAVERFPSSRYARAFFGTGFLGAYTTFSTYMVQTVLLTKDGHAIRATAYLLATVVVGLLASWFGLVLGHRLGGRGHLADPPPDPR